MINKRNTTLAYWLAVVLTFIFSIGPILWTLIISFTPENNMLQPGSIIPSNLILDNYAALLDSSSKISTVVLNGLGNSLYVSALTLVIGLPLAILAGYALAKLQFKGKSFIIGGILLTIPIPVFATIIPVYSLFRDMDLLNSMFWTAIIYCSSFLPLNIWIIMNYMKNIPDEIMQAAQIDGLSERQTFFRIILPMSQPIVLTSALIMFLMSWKQYIIPMILISSPQNKMLTMIMSEFMTRDAIQYGNIAAAGMIAIIPPAIVAIVFRKFLIDGMTSSGIKQ